MSAYSQIQEHHARTVEMLRDAMSLLFRLNIESMELNGLRKKYLGLLADENKLNDHLCVFTNIHNVIS